MIDGIQNKIDPGEPLDKDIYDLSPEEVKTCRRRLARWRPALAALAPTTNSSSAATCSPPDVIETWIRYKKVNEVQAMQLRPHPYEFCLYYDL